MGERRFQSVLQIFIHFKETVQMTERTSVLRYA